MGMFGGKQRAQVIHRSFDQSTRGQVAYWQAGPGSLTAASRTADHLVDERIVFAHLHQRPLFFTDAQPEKFGFARWKLASASPFGDSFRSRRKYRRGR